MSLRNMFGQHRPCEKKKISKRWRRLIVTDFVVPMCLEYVQYRFYVLRIVDSGTLLTFLAEGHGTLFERISGGIE